MRLGWLIRRRVATARRVHDEAGSAGLAFLLLCRMAPRPLHLEWLVVFERRPVPRPGGIDSGVRWAGPGDLAQLAALGQGPAVVGARLARGDRAAALFQRDRIVAYAWYRTGSEPNTAIRFEIEPGAVWGYDMTVAPECRGRRLAARVLDWAEAALAAEGVRRIVSTVDVFNAASLRLAVRRGASRLGTVVVVGAAGVTLRREAWAGRRPRWSVDRGAGVVPVPSADGGRPLAGALRARGARRPSPPA